MGKQYSVAETRNRLTRILHEVEEGKVVEVTRRGKTVVVMLSAKQYLRHWKRRRSFYDALMEWRRKYNVEALGIGPEIWEGVRDKSPGRDVTF